MAETVTHDPVDHPQHYTFHCSGVEAIELCEEMTFCLGNAVKYLFRHEHKGAPVEDLRKAAWYLRRERDRLIQSEVWAVFPDDARYEISTLGHVRRTKTGRLRSPTRIKNGYYTFLLCTPDGPALHYVHVAVAATFLGERPPGLCVAHGDGNKGNNHVNNLRYATYSENAADRRAHGTANDGAGNGRAVLDEQQVGGIRRRWRDGDSIGKLARSFGVSRSTVTRITHGIAWRPKARRPLALVLQADPGGILKDVLTILGRTSGTEPADVEKAAQCVEREVGRLER